MRYFTKVAEGEKSPNVKYKGGRPGFGLLPDKKENPVTGGVPNTSGVGTTSGVGVTNPGTTTNQPASNQGWIPQKPEGMAAPDASVKPEVKPSQPSNTPIMDSIKENVSWAGNQMSEYLKGNQGAVPDLLTGGTPTREAINTAKDTAIDYVGDKIKDNTDITPGSGTPHSNLIDTAVENTPNMTNQPIINTLAGAGAQVGGVIKDTTNKAWEAGKNALTNMGSSLLSSGKKNVDFYSKKMMDGANRMKNNKPEAGAGDAVNTAPDAPTPELPAE